MLKAGERRPAERAASKEKGKDDANEERTSKEEEDYNNNKEKDCAAAAAATAAATASGGHGSFINLQVRTFYVTFPPEFRPEFLSPEFRTKLN